MPRGGARNTGKKWKWSPEAKARLEARKKSNSKPDQSGSKPANQPQAFDANVILQIMEAGNERARKRVRTEEWCPYSIHPDRFGPVSGHIAKNKPRKSMAMDSNLQSQNQFAVQAWMAGGLLGAVVSEGLTFLGYPYLSELAQRPEFRLFGEIRAEEMTRKWTAFRGVKDESTKEEKKPDNDNDDDKQRARFRQAADAKPRTDARNKEIEDKIKELSDFEEELQVRAWFRAAAAHDSYFGIGHLYVDTKGVDINNRTDPELAKPIGNGRDKVSRAKLKGNKGFLRGIRAIEPIWVYPTTYNAQNPLIPSWYDPQVWYVMGSEVHKTRMLSLIGRPVPDILKPAYAFGGLSQTQLAQPYVEIWLKTRSSVGEIIHAYSVMVLLTQLATTTMPGGSGAGDGNVLARGELFNYLRDNMGLFVLDKNTEDFKNVSASLAGLPELQAQSQEHMASVARIPLVKFTGVQPMGLNATSEGELRAFEETIAGTQEHLFRPNLTTIYDFMQISLWGERDEDITYDFVPLREETPKEKAEMRKMDAETDQIRIDSGVVSQEEARTKLANDEESGYDSIDPDDVPDLLEEIESGLEPEGGRPQPLAGGQAKPKPQAQAGDDMPSPEQVERNLRVPAGLDKRKGKKT